MIGRAVDVRHACTAISFRATTPAFLRISCAAFFLVLLSCFVSSSRAAEPAGGQADAETILRSNRFTKTIALTRPEAVVGMLLPAGTEVTIDSAKGGRIIEAVLREKAEYLGLDLPPGTRLGLMSRLKQGQIMGRPDRLGEMWITGLEQPSMWRLGPLRIRGYIELLKQDGAYLVRCFRGTSCLYGKGPVFEAWYGSDWQLTSVAVANLAPLSVTVDGKTLKAGYASFWPGGKPRTLGLHKAQRFHGRRLAGELRLWSNGGIQKWNEVAGKDMPRPARFCRDGHRERPMPAIMPETVVLSNQCDDGSILYVDAELLCKRSDLARKQLDFLRDRPLGLPAECDADYAETDDSGRFKVIYRDPSR